MNEKTKSEDCVNQITMEGKQELENYRQWLKKANLEKSPFTLEINPTLRVGYDTQISKLLKNIDQRHKIILLVGPTGSGKTSLINHLCSEEKKFYHMPKPPRETIDLLNLPSNFHKEIPIFTRIFTKKPKDIQHLPTYLNKILPEHRVLFVDEAHEASVEVLEWFRVISDQVQNLTIIFSALPTFEDILTQNLETLKKRITEKVELNALSREETEELIRKRIKNAGGSGINPFTKEAIDYIYQRTGGFPRDILTLSNSLLNLGAEKNVDLIGEGVLPKKNAPQKRAVDLGKLTTLPDKQKRIIDLLLNYEPMSPPEISEHMPEYPTPKHALRAVNNLLKRMLDEGYIERSKTGKTYKYILSPSTRTKLIRA